MQSLYNAFLEVGRNYTKEQFDQEFLGHFIYNFFVKYKSKTINSAYLVIFRLLTFFKILGAQWLSGRVLDLRPKGGGFEPHLTALLSLSKTHLS